MERDLGMNVDFEGHVLRVSVKCVCESTGVGDRRCVFDPVLPGCVVVVWATSCLRSFDIVYTTLYLEL
jgi:hypothetical protein